MMVNFDYSMLIGRIIEKYKTRRAFANKMKISEHTLSKKLNGHTPFDQSEMMVAVELLEETTESIKKYFFTQKVQQVEQNAYERG